MFCLSCWNITSLFFLIFFCFGFVVLFCYIVFLFFFNRCQCIACFGKLFAFIFRFCNFFVIIVNNFCFIIESDKIQASSFMGALFAVAFFGIVCQGMLGDLVRYLTTTLHTYGVYGDNPGLNDQVLLVKIYLAKNHIEIPVKTSFEHLIPAWYVSEGREPAVLIEKKGSGVGFTYVYDSGDGFYSILLSDPRDEGKRPAQIFFLGRVENPPVVPFRLMGCKYASTVSICPPYFHILTVLPVRWKDYDSLFYLLHLDF